MSDFHNYSVDDGATLCVGSDRYACTVINVSKTGKTVRVQQDHATLRNQDGKGIFGNQEYDYTPNADGPIYDFRLSRTGNKIFKMGDFAVLIPGRKQYYNPEV